MALTREERLAIQEMQKRIKYLEDRVGTLENSLNSLIDMVNRLDAEENMADWTHEQWRKFLQPFLSTFEDGYIPKHDHKTDRTGGSCFAKLGANLINGE